MKVFNENLYFVTTGAECFCEIIAYRSNAGKFNLGDNALDMLGVSGEERGFLIRNLFSGGDSPIIILSESGALIFNRQMLYSTGICCIAQLDVEPDSICLLFDRELIRRAIMSPQAKALASQADDNCNEAYITVSRLERLLSIFCERGADAADCDMIRTASLICDGVGCEIVSCGETVVAHKFVSGGMIYAHSIYALSVLLFAFLAKIISDDRTLSVEQSADGVKLSVRCDCGFPGIRKIMDCIMRVAQERGVELSFDTNDGLTLDICPFFLDIGLTGVKNPARLKQE